MLACIPVLVGVTLAVLSLLFLIPGDPVKMPRWPPAVLEHDWRVEVKLGPHASDLLGGVANSASIIIDAS